MGKVVVVEWLSAEKMLSRCLPPPPSPSGVNAMLMGQGVHFLSTTSISSYPFYFDKLSCALRFLCMTQVYFTDLPKGIDMILCCLLMTHTHKHAAELTLKVLY